MESDQKSEQKKARQLEANRRWKERNRAAVREYNRQWAKDNPDRNREQTRRWRSKNKAKASQMDASYRSRNKEKIATYFRDRKKNDPDYKMRANLRSRLNTAIKRGYKQGSAVRDLGCTIDQFWTHMENLFQPGMTRENMGTAWEIDHIFPLSKADLTGSRTEFLAANNWRNLQPLTPEQNWEKGDTITPEAQALFDSLCLEFRTQVAA